METEAFSLIPQALFLWPLLLFLTLFYYVLRQTYWNNNKLRSLTPPSPPQKLPIIGHLHLLTDMPHYAFTKFADKLGPIIYLQLGRVPTVVVSSAELAQLILKTHDHVFASRPKLLTSEYLSFGWSDVTFSPYGAYWRQARRIFVTYLFSPKRVKSFHAVRNDEINLMLTAMSSRSGSKTNVTDMFFNLANDVLCRVAFGKRFMEGSGEGETSHLASVLAETEALFSGFCVGDFFPGWWWGWVNRVSGHKRRLTKNLKALREVCDEIIEEHLKKKNSPEHEDFMDVLLRVQKRDDLEVPITDDNLKALVLDLFVAGTDTSSATLEWAMTELIRNRRLLKKAQEEVRRIASGSRTVEETTHIHQLTYLQAVIKEAMRLHTPVPLLLPRESMERCNLLGYEIPAKTRILVNSYAIGRDSKSWENPLEFIPERFIENNIEFKDQDFRFLPFGGGRRGCPGYGFGLVTVQLALARLLYHFDWSLPEGVRADDIDLQEIFGLGTRKKHALFLVPQVNKEYEFKGNDV